MAEYRTHSSTYRLLITMHVKRTIPLQK